MQMSRRRIDWREGTWTNLPVSSSQENGGLVVEAVSGSDYWQKTIYGFQHENGHALLAPWNPGSAMEVTFRLENFPGLFDQAGLMVWHSPLQWIKTGIEMSDGVLCIGAVLTDPYSDWSLFPIPETWIGQELTMRASVLNDGVVIRAKSPGSRWQTIRAARFPYADNLQAGPFLCAPSREGLKVTFTEWRLNDPDVDIHTDPV